MLMFENAFGFVGFVKLRINDLSNLYNPIYAICVYLVALLVAGIILRVSPFCRKLTETDNSRFRALDGLRGFLALGVFIHHASVRYVCERTGVWTYPDSDLYHFLGSGCVALFFMITGFLFWSKGLSNPKSVSYPRLLKGRVARLVPMYLASYSLILLLIGIGTHFKLKETPLALCSSIAVGAMAGIFDVPNVNGWSCGTLNAGVVWSLYYEWRFYFVLPLLAFFFRGPKRLTLLTAAFVALAITHNDDYVHYMANFLGGMIAAQILHSFSTHRLIESKIFGATSTILMLVVACSFSHLPFWAVTLGLLPFFVSVLYGFSCFGLFTSRASVLLGSMAYSVYLAHGIFLHLYTYVMNHYFISAKVQSPFAYWLSILPLTAIVVVTSFLTFRFIEYPFIGKRGKPKTSDIDPAALPEIKSYASATV